MRSGVGMDLGIVIALKEEFREFMALLPVQPTPERDPATGQYGYVFEHPVSHRRCVVTLIGEMNPEPAALQTERPLSHWTPRTVVMLGIAAGIHPDVRVGDVVIASQVDNYLATAKAQAGSAPDSFELSLGGTVFHADFNLLTQVRNFEFFAPEVFSRWQQDCARVLAELVPEEEVRTALLQKGLVRAAPDLLDAHLASEAIHHGLRQMGQAAQFARISVQGPRPLLGFDEMVNGQLVKTYQVSTNGLHWAVRVNGRIVDAYTGLAGLPEEEYMQRLQPYPGARIVVDLLEEML